MSQERIAELERKWEDLRVKRIQVDKEVNVLRRKAAMNPTDPRVRRDLERAEKMLAQILEEESKVWEELERLRQGEGAEEAKKEGGEG